MRTKGQVKQKLKQVLYRHRKKYVQEGLKKCPENCKFNKCIDIPHFMEDLGFCIHEKNELSVCSSFSEEFDQSSNCSLFEPLKDSEELKQDFSDVYERGGDIGVIASSYPDVAALVWVLNEEGEDEP